MKFIECVEEDDNSNSEDSSSGLFVVCLYRSDNWMLNLQLLLNCMDRRVCLCLVRPNSKKSSHVNCRRKYQSICKLRVMLILSVVQADEIKSIPFFH